MGIACLGVSVEVDGNAVGSDQAPILALFDVAILRGRRDVLTKRVVDRRIFPERKWAPCQIQSHGSYNGSWIFDDENIFIILLLLIRCHDRNSPLSGIVVVG